MTLAQVRDLVGSEGLMLLSAFLSVVFLVLKSPDIPSILVETAFISNPTEEARLGNARHQQRLAEAIYRGVRGYFYENPPPGTLVSQLRAQSRDPSVIASAKGESGTSGTGQ